GEAHRVISEGYASSDFDSVQSGELQFEENVRPTGEHVGVDLLNPSADARNYKERVRRQCHKLAAKSEIFTGKSSQEITIASLHRDTEETAEDHGWDELSVGSYYLEVSTEQNARKELQYSGALVEDSDEISIWRNGPFEL
ncbi:hypothetical protein FOZ62_010910, partial [Perkinsus olseni]